MAEHRTEGDDVPSSCLTAILRRLCKLCVHKPKPELLCYTGRKTETADGVRGVSKQSSLERASWLSACAGNRGWGYADSNDGRREVCCLGCL